MYRGALTRLNREIGRTGQPLAAKEETQTLQNMKNGPIRLTRKRVKCLQRLEKLCNGGDQIIRNFRY
jgi:hypothetical protein